MLKLDAKEKEINLLYIDQDLINKNNGVFDYFILMKIMKDITIHQKEYMKTYKELKKKGIVNSKVKLGDLKSLLTQVGGDHYKKMVVQPAEFINKNKLLFAEGNASGG